MVSIAHFVGSEGVLDNNGQILHKECAFRSTRGGSITHSMEFTRKNTSHGFEVLYVRHFLFVALLKYMYGVAGRAAIRTNERTDQVMENTNK